MNQSLPALTVALAPDLGTQIEALARHQQKPVAEVVTDACRQHLSAHSAPDLDSQYARGYQQIPEEISDVEALLPHLPVPSEDW